MSQSGYTPILIYASGTATNVPLAANLTSSASGAELALNYADGKLYFKNSSGVVTLLSASGGGPAGGSNTQVQFNSSGVLAGSASFTWDGTTLVTPSHTTNTATTGSTNKGPLNYGTLSFSDTGIVQSAQTSVNSYFQNVIQNTSAGTAASAEFIAYNDQGTASTNYATVGINSSGYTGTGSINAPGYAYFLSASTDLVLGTIGANGIHFTTNSSATDALAISSAGAVSLPGGAANGIAYLNGSKVVTTGSALTFDGTNLGVGFTPSAWTSYKAVQVGTTGAASLASSNSSEATIFANSYLNGGVFKYINSAAAGYYSQSSGSHAWAIAPSGTAGNTITFTQAMTLDASGNLGLGVVPNGWNTSGSSYKAIQLGVTGSIYGRTSNEVINVASNTYVNSSGVNTYIASGNTASIYQQASGQHAWYNAPSGTAGNAITFTQAMTLNASGQFMVGTTTALGAAATFYGQNATVVIAQGSASGYAGLRFFNDQNSIYRALEIDYMGSTFPGGEMANLSTTGAYPMVFGTNNTERMRIDSSGNLLVGTTSTSGNAGIQFLPSSQLTSINHISGTGSGAYYTSFNYNGSSIGSITQSGTTAVLYNLTSDQRLKNNIADAAPASDLIDAIQVRQYDWKSDGSHQRYGFIAQELVTVAPEAVHQPADPEEMMAVDYSKLVPMLVKEIQSLRARVAQLETAPFASYEQFGIPKP